MDIKENNGPTTAERTETPSGETKFCSHCGQKVLKAAVVCPHCGCQLEQLNSSVQQQQPQIIINNTNTNTNVNKNSSGGKVKNKWTAFLLCLLLGFFGAHKFYEGKFVMGLVYLFTAGLFGFGVLIDLVVLLFKPLHYTV